jgi:ATP-binding cassette subfamily F protein 3
MIAIRLDKVSVTYIEKPVFTDLSWDIHGDRCVGLIGPNGSGKSTLLRLIGGQVDSDTGYYSQEHETLDYQSTLIDTVRRSARLTESETVGFLGKFLFDYEQARGLVSNLSGGERSRLQLAMLMLSNANFLLLDEPTNNLDIPSAEVLEDALADFEGTVFVISHDRYFLDRVVDRVIELKDGDLRQFTGNFSDYQAAQIASHQF